MDRCSPLASFLRTTAAVILAGGLLVSCAASGPDTSPVSADFLIGTWTVDLRPMPTADPYYKTFVVTSVDGNSFEGTFYDTPVSEGRINADWGKLRIAFVTADGSGAYHHSAVLEDDRLEGMSNSTGRGFLAYWSAVKQ
jgi:hypothetical protein